MLWQKGLAGFTAGQDFHLTPKINCRYYSIFLPLVNAAAKRYNAGMGTIKRSPPTETIVFRAHRSLMRARATVAVAESCTGGLLSSLLTRIPGSSSYFLEGIVVYSNAAKTRLLSIPASLIKKKGAVSPEVAHLLAANVRRKSGADFGIGLTGIAGPSGGTKTKPRGTVYIAVDDGNQIDSCAFLFTGSRQDIRLKSSLAALTLLTTHANIRRDRPSR